MNRKPVVFILFLFCTVVAGAINSSDIVNNTFEETPGEGLAIYTNPEGVKVYIDGVYKGLTPITFDSLASGNYLIFMEKEGYKEEIFDVTIFKNSRLNVIIKMEEERGIAKVTVRRTNDSPRSLSFEPQFITESSSEILSTTRFNDGSVTILIDMPAGSRSITARAFGWEESKVTIQIHNEKTVETTVNMKPAAFKIENPYQNRKRFNPANPSNLGSTEIYFNVSAPGNGAIIITDKDDTIVYKSHLHQFTSWDVHLSWNGRNNNNEMLPEGTYKIIIEATPITIISEEQSEPSQLTMNVYIDYSINIFPLSFASGISGLTFAPLPYVLPTGSYQLEAGLYYGSFQSLTEFPFEIGFRISPFNKFEISTVFNLNPVIDNTGWGISGSVKYNIFEYGKIPLALAAAASYTWANKNGEAPLNSGRGIVLYTPLSLKLMSKFSFVFSPGVFWHDKEHTTELLLSTGALYRGDWINAGVSTRIEIDFTKDISPKLFAGAETHIYRSSLVLSLQGGMWTQNSNYGGYGGVGLGIIY